MSFFLPPEYTERTEPRFDDHASHEATGIRWQADVYRFADWLSAGLGARVAVDIGSGHGARLLEHFQGLDVVGIDTPDNVAWCESNRDRGTWISADLERGLPELAAETAEGAVLVCADVVEHLVDPRPLLAGIRRVLDGGAHAAVFSTPDRLLTYGFPHLGPPKNACHVREWAADEFRRLLVDVDLAPTFLGHVPSHDGTVELSTILAVVERRRDRASGP